MMSIWPKKQLESLEKHIWGHSLKFLQMINSELNQLTTIVGENYFGQSTVQLRTQGGSAFKAISDRLVLKASSDLAFGEGSEKMLQDKELKAKQKEVEQIEAE